MSAMGDERRLEEFEGFARDVRAELAETNARMDALRAEGKIKTATYRQLFANRVTLQEIDARLSERGL